MNQDIVNELKELEQAGDDGVVLLDKRNVWAFAQKRRDSAIGQWMERRGAFDPVRAMEKYGLALAGKLIVRVKVLVQVREEQVVRVRGYFSPLDRRQSGGGFEATVPALSHRERKRMLLLTAVAELKALQRKYDALKLLELGPVFEAVEEVAARLEPAAAQAG
jgi:hypothetical protein